MKSLSYRLLPLCLVATLPLALRAQTTEKPAPPPQPLAGQSATDMGSAYYHYMLSHEYEEMAETYGNSDYATRAIEEYKMALNDDPSSKYLNSHLADLYFATGHIREAIEAAQDQIKRNPNDLEAHRLLAEVYLRSLGNDEQSDVAAQMMKLAIGEYEKIVQLAPNSPDDHLMLARLYAADHDNAKAEEQIAAAQQINPGSEETALIANRFYTDIGDNQKAVAVLRSLPPDDQTARTEYQLGITFDGLRDQKDAVAAFREALNLEPDNLDVEKALAQDLTATDQTQDALKAWQDVAAGDPTDADAWGQIAQIEEANNQFSSALDAVRRARDLDSANLEYEFEEATIDDALGHLDDAVKVYSQLAAATEHASGVYSDREKGNYALVLDRLAQVYREQCRPDQAIATYQKKASLGGEFEQEAYDQEVETWRDAHEYDKAVSTAQEAVQKQPKSLDAKLTLARQLADTGHADQGVAMAKGLVASNPKNLETYYQLAQIYTDLRKWKDAADVLNTAQTQAAKKDDQMTVDFERAMMEDRAKRYDAAESDFQKVLSMDPDNALTLNNYGFMLADRGVDLDQALTMIQKAVRLEPTNYAYLDSLGWAYYRLGHYAQAQDNLQQAISRDGDDPTVHEHLGDVYEKTGRLKEAAAQWELSLNEFAHTVQADMDPGEEAKVQKKLDSARVRLAKESNNAQPAKPE
jgi:tetratricopeptide (TPR) repeat protein